jgi:hypothetical protein
MTYDWDGIRTRRARFMRITSVFMFCVAVPAGITLWQIYAA